MQLKPDGTPVGWSLDRGSDASLAPPCSVDKTHSAGGSHSIKCNVLYYPMPNPFDSSSNTTTPESSDESGGTSNTRSDTQHYAVPHMHVGVGQRSEPMIFNYSGASVESLVVRMSAIGYYLLEPTTCWNLLPVRTYYLLEPTTC